MRGRNPELAGSYDIYILCRQQQLFTVNVTKGKSTVTKVVPWTTGIALLPEPGGLLDQPHRLMSLFQSFLAGEHTATFKDLA